MVDPRSSDEWNYVAPDAANTPVRELRKSMHMPMWLFVAYDGARVLSKLPVDVEVTREGSDAECNDAAIVFSCKNLHVFASAPTYKEAEDQFHDQVVHFFHVYRDSDPYELAPDALEIQALYNEHFQVSPAA